MLDPTCVSAALLSVFRCCCGFDFRGMSLRSAGLYVLDGALKTVGLVSYGHSCVRVCEESFILSHTSFTRARSDFALDTTVPLLRLLLLNTALELAFTRAGFSTGLFAQSFSLVLTGLKLVSSLGTGAKETSTTGKLKFLIT